MGKFAKVCQFAPYIPLLCIAICMAFLAQFSSLTAHAQGVFVTPTPLPAIVATTNAATQSQSAAQAQIEQARADKARADEMLRNGEAQAAQAQADIEAARQAAQAQNIAAAGEAIGRVEQTLNQLRDTVRGQAEIIDESATIRASQAMTIEQQSQRIQTLETDKKTILANFNAMSDAKEQAAKNGDSNIIIYLVIGLLVVCVLAVVIIAWLQRRSGESAPDDADDDHVDAEFDVSKVE